jgi:hypothetical protein
MGWLLLLATLQVCELKRVASAGWPDGCVDASRKTEHLCVRRIRLICTKDPVKSHENTGPKRPPGARESLFGG